MSPFDLDWPSALDSNLQTPVPNAFPKTKKAHLSMSLSDLRRIQTCNLLSRNQVLYSVELGGRFSECKSSSISTFTQ